MSNNPESITILMADDDAEDRMLAKEALAEARLGNELLFVENGEELLDFLHRRGPYVDLADSPLPGIILLGGYFSILPLILAKTVFKKLLRDMGFIRFGIFMMLFLITLAVPIKMVGRWLFNLKYIVAITELFFNI